MKKIERAFFALGLVPLFASLAFADDIVVNTPYNPATGVWIQQVGDLYPSASTKETVYYTRYSAQQSAKALDYYYDGNGYLKLDNRRLLCRTKGADGIVHHPDGDLLVAGQDYNEIYKVNMNASDTSTSKCVVKTETTKGVGASTFHLMMNPDNSVLWSAGIPGNLFTFRTDSAASGRLQLIRQVRITGSVSNITTLLWDNSGQAYYTRSSNLGTITRSSNYNAQFGMIVDTTCSINANPCPARYITGLKTKTLIDSLKGAHGASFDEYSNTILLFGDSHIVQIDPKTRKVVADVDLRKYMFPDSLMTGNYSTNTETVVSSNSRSSSSAAVFHESSSSKASSSSTAGGSGSKSSNSGANVSSSGTSGSGSSSSGTGTSGSSGSDGSLSSGAETGASSSSGGTVLSSGSEGSGSSSSGSGSGESSSGSGTGEDGSSSSDGSENSSSSANGSGGDWVPPWIADSTTYEGFDDDGTVDQDGTDRYPTNDKRDKGDTLVSGGSKLIPVPDDTSAAGKVVINGNTYITGGGSQSTELPSYGSDTTLTNGREAVQVGDVIEITLDADKIRDYFGDVDSLYISGSTGLSFKDPTNTSGASSNISIGVTGKDLSFWVTADTVVSGGTIYITDKDGNLIIFDGINFYDPIPKAEIGYIQDVDDDGELDSLEVILSDTIPAGISATGMALVVNGDTLPLTGAVTVSGSRIYANASELRLSSDNFPEDARVIITYTSDETGANYNRSSELLVLGSHVIKRAYAIRNTAGEDSLFVEFNIDVIPADLNSPEMIVWLNSMGFDLDAVRIYLPTKNMIILVGDSLGLSGRSDYVTLAPGASFHNLSYIATSEYERQVPVTVVDRYPAANVVEYYDTDGDGALDSIAVKFSSKVSAEELQNYYFSFPWYSSRGLLIELQAQPRDLILSSDGKSVGWVVKSNVNVAPGLTSISSEVPAATLYTYYEIFGNTFVAQQTVAIEDKMAPVIASASLHYGDSRDTLTVSFSEPVDYSSLSGSDFFSYIHGSDTIDIRPSRMLWAADGKSVRLVLRESTDGIVPGDSLLVVKGAKSAIADIYGNRSVENASPVVIGGLLGQIVESINMGTYDPEKYVTNTLNSVSISYVSNQTRTSDLRDQGTLGHLISLGERFVPQLIDGAKLDADGNYDPSVLDSIDPGDVFVNFSVSYFDNLGQYVTDTTFNIPCNSAAFGASQNCLATDKKVFVNWNYKDHTGRLVGSGVYIVEFKLVVRYKQKKVQEEMRDKWGVRRKKNK